MAGVHDQNLRARRRARRQHGLRAESRVKQVPVSRKVRHRRFQVPNAEGQEGSDRRYQLTKPSS